MSQKLTYPLPDVYIWNYPIFHSDFWGMSEKGVASVSHYTSNGRSGRICHTAVVAVPQSSRLGEDCGFPCWSHNQAQSLSHTPRSHLTLLFPTICSERDDLTVSAPGIPHEVWVQVLSSGVLRLCGGSTVFTSDVGQRPEKHAGRWRGCVPGGTPFKPPL